MSGLRLLAKDLRVEIRSRDVLTATLVTGLLVVAVGALAFHDAHGDAHLASGILWTGLAFSSALTAARSLGSERDGRTLDLLLVLPAPRAALYAAKVAGAFALLLVVAAALVGGLVLLGGGEVSVAGWTRALPFVLLGALGLAGAGVAQSALALHARARDALVPVLLVPLLAPLLVACVHGTADALHGLPFAAWRPELLVLAGYDLAFLAAASLLFEHAVEAA